MTASHTTLEHFRPAANCLSGRHLRQPNIAVPDLAGAPPGNPGATRTAARRPRAGAADPLTSTLAPDAHLTRSHLADSSSSPAAPASAQAVLSEVRCPAGRLRGPRAAHRPQRAYTGALSPLVARPATTEPAR